MVEPVHHSIIIPVNENTVDDALARLKAKGDTTLTRFLADVICALWAQNRDQERYIISAKEWVAEARKQVRQEKLF